jgi:hypothetical protein
MGVRVQELSRSVNGLGKDVQRRQLMMSAIAPKANMPLRDFDVRFGPQSDDWGQFNQYRWHQIGRRRHGRSSLSIVDGNSRFLGKQECGYY